MKRCSKCALPETYPGIDFDAKGICNYCNYLKASKDMRESLRESLKQEFISLIEKAKKASGRYDCIVCYSGGKDSTYLLSELKEKFDLKILAYTLDNGYISEKATANIKKVVESLDVDHITYRPRQKVINRIFRDVLTKKIEYPTELVSMLSPLCATCQGIVLGFAVEYAIKHDIPIVFVGFTPGQYPDVSYENFLKSKSCIYLTNKVYKDDPPDIIKMIRDPIDEVSGEEAGEYYLKSQYVEDEKYPHILFPFQTVFKYDEKKIYKAIKKYGWQKPQDTDTCSTNCLVNSVGNFAFMKQYGYHPYIAEISSLVRDGLLSYSKVSKLEEIDGNSKTLNTCLRRLGITKKDIMR